MSILSNIFSGNDSDSSNSTDIISDVGAVIGLAASSDNSNFSQDEDGSIESSSSSQDLGLLVDTDSLLGILSDNNSSSDDDGGSLSL